MRATRCRVDRRLATCAGGGRWEGIAGGGDRTRSQPSELTTTTTTSSCTDGRGRERTAVAATGGRPAYGSDRPVVGTVDGRPGRSRAAAGRRRGRKQNGCCGCGRTPSIGPDVHALRTHTLDRRRRLDASATGITAVPLTAGRLVEFTDAPCALAQTPWAATRRRRHGRRRQQRRRHRAAHRRRPCRHRAARRHHWLAAPVPVQQRMHQGLAALVAAAARQGSLLLLALRCPTKMAAAD